MERRNRKLGRPRLAGEAEGPQSVRPPGAENYPEPCSREEAEKTGDAMFTRYLTPGNGKPCLSILNERRLNAVPLTRRRIMSCGKIPETWCPRVSRNRKRAAELPGWHQPEAKRVACGEVHLEPGVPTVVHRALSRSRSHRNRPERGSCFHYTMGQTLDVLRGRLVNRHFTHPDLNEGRVEFPAGLNQSLHRVDQLRESLRCHSSALDQANGQSDSGDDLGRPGPRYVSPGAIVPFCSTRPEGRVRIETQPRGRNTVGGRRQN